MIGVGVGLPLSTKKVYADSTTYDFTETENHELAWEYTVSGTDEVPDLTPSEVPSSGTDATASDNDAIASSDDSRWSTSGGQDTEEEHYFRFDIQESRSNIDNFTVTWEGYGDDEVSGYVEDAFIWNLNSSSWEQFGDGSSGPDITFTFENDNAERYIDSDGKLWVSAVSHSATACPTLYTEVDDKMEYTGVISTAGALGFSESGGIAQSVSRPVDWTVLQDSDAESFVISEELSGEVQYVDSVEVWEIYHPPNTQLIAGVPIWLTRENFPDEGYREAIHTIKNPRSPISAVNENGNSVLDEISKIDKNYTEKGTAHEHDIITLDLGNLENAKQIKLVLKGTTGWINSPPNDRTSYIEVLNENGKWERANWRLNSWPEFSRINVKTFAIDITDWFLTDNYMLRINDWHRKAYDYIAVDTSKDSYIVLSKQVPESELFWKGVSTSIRDEGGALYFDYDDIGDTNNRFYGNFTKFGETTSLTSESDDKFAIIGAGDALKFDFNQTSNLLPYWKQEYVAKTDIFYKQDWVKHLFGNDSSHVKPLPFHDMSYYPYPDDENFPWDNEHQEWWNEYQTRYQEPSGHYTIYTDYVKTDVTYTTDVNQSPTVENLMSENITSSSADLSVDVSDPDGDDIDWVAFYDNSNDSLIDNVTTTKSEPATYSTTWGDDEDNLNSMTSYSWYAKASDNNNNVSSASAVDTFTTEAPEGVWYVSTESDWWDNSSVQENDIRTTIKNGSLCLTGENSVLWLPLDEGSGTTAGDSTSHNNDGSISGATWTTGQWDNALDFDGSDDHISFSDDSDFDIHEGKKVSFNFWVKPDLNNMDAYGGIIGYFVDGSWTVQWGTLMYDTGKFRIMIKYSDDTNWTKDFTGFFSDDTWVHVGVTLDASNGEYAVYKNGTEFDSGSFTAGDLDYGNHSAYIGETGSGYNAGGIIDEVIVFDTILSENQMKRFYGRTEPSAFEGTTTIYPGSSVNPTLTGENENVPTYPYPTTQEDPLDFVEDPDATSPAIENTDVDDYENMSGSPEDPNIVADPHIFIDNDDSWHIFFEVGKVGDSTCRVDVGHATSSDNGLTWTYDQIVLKDNWNRSNPYVFKNQENYYMVPCVGNDAENLQLFTTNNFPYDWTMDQNLLSNVGYQIADTAIFRYNGKWWILAGKSATNETYAYYSDTLKGSYSEHSNNPVQTGDPDRPIWNMVTQDNTVIVFRQPTTGDVKAFEITTLTTTSYSETSLGTVWSGGHHAAPWYMGDGNGWRGIADTYSGSAEDSTLVVIADAYTRGEAYISDGVWTSTIWDSGASSEQQVDNLEFSLSQEANENIYANIGVDEDDDGTIDDNTGWNQISGSSWDSPSLNSGYRFQVSYKLETDNTTHSPSVQDYTLNVSEAEAKAWNDVESWSGDISNSSTWSDKESWTGELSNTASWHDRESWTGELDIRKFEKDTFWVIADAYDRYGSGKHWKDAIKYNETWTQQEKVENLLGGGYYDGTGHFHSLDNHWWVCYAADNTKWKFNFDWTNRESKNVGVKGYDMYQSDNGEFAQVTGGGNSVAFYDSNFNSKLREISLRDEVPEAIWKTKEGYWWIAYAQPDNVVQYDSNWNETGKEYSLSSTGAPEGMVKFNNYWYVIDGTPAIIDKYDNDWNFVSKVLDLSDSYSNIDSIALVRAQIWNDMESWTGDIEETEAKWNDADSWTGTIKNVESWYDVESMIGSIKNESSWHSRTIWNGTLVQTANWTNKATLFGDISNSAGWYDIESWSGDIPAMADWKDSASWTGDINNSAFWNGVMSWTGDVSNSASFYDVESWSGSIYSSDAWNDIETWSGTIYNTAEWHDIEMWNGTLDETISQWNDIKIWDGTVEETVTSWNTKDSWSGSLDVSLDWYDIKTWSGSVLNTEEWHDAESWSGSILNTEEWFDVDSWNGSVNNSPSWDEIDMWGGTLEAPSSWTQRDVWSGSILNSSDWNDMDSWSGNIGTVAAVWNNMEIWTGTIEETISSWQDIDSWTGSLEEVEAVWHDEMSWSGTIKNTEAWQDIDSWNGSVSNSVSWKDGQSWTGAIKNVENWHDIQSISGTIEAPASWYDMRSWTGTIEETVSSWQDIEDWTGSIGTVTVVWNDMESWTGDISNAPTWNDMSVWSGTVKNVEDWHDKSSWSGSVKNIPTYHDVDVWSGDVQEGIASWHDMKSWTGSVESAGVWSDMETWSGDISNSAIWNTLDTWSGTVAHGAAWYDIEIWSGDLNNSSAWSTEAQFDGSILNTAEWADIDVWSGTVKNVEEWRDIESWTGAINHGAMWHDMESWNGSIEHAGEWYDVEGWTGTLENSASWYDSMSWTGTIKNVESWHDMEIWAGTVAHGAAWQDAETWTGTIKNIQEWYDAESWTGELSNISDWHDIEIWSGTVKNIEGWKDMESWSGSISHGAAWVDKESWSGSIVSAVTWHDIESWSGAIEGSVGAWYDAGSWTGTLNNSSSWYEIENWTGTISHEADWYDMEVWTGTVSHGAAWNTADSWTGEVNSTVSWYDKASWNGTLNNSSTWNDEDSWIGVVEHVEGWSDADVWTGTVAHGAMWHDMEVWTGTVETIGGWNDMVSWNGSIVGGEKHWIDIEGWDGYVRFWYREPTRHVEYNTPWGAYMIVGVFFAALFVAAGYAYVQKQKQKRRKAF